MDPHIFIINVGVNASHGKLKSPLFKDGSFIFVSIPEPRFPDCPLLSRYRDILPCVLEYIPKSYLDVRVHKDPEFETFTYGDYPTKSPKAALLKRIKPGDFLFFLARLTLWSNSERSFTNKAGFYIIGYFRVEQVIPEVTPLLQHTVLQYAANNAHVKRGKCDVNAFDRFWIIRGSSESLLLPQAMPFNRDFANLVMRDRYGKPWKWGSNRSDLQVIGSYTRSCRMITDQNKVRIFLREVERYAFK